MDARFGEERFCVNGLNTCSRSQGPPSNAPSCTNEDILLSNSLDVLLAFASSNAWATRAAAWARGGFFPKALVSALENTPCRASNRTQFSLNLSRATHGGAFSGTSKMACGACTALRMEDVRFGCIWSSSITSLSSPQMASRKEKSAMRLVWLLSHKVSLSAQRRRVGRG